MGDLMDNDDDFGNIYTDVECQASSVINSVFDLDKLYTEPPQEEGAGEEDKGGEFSDNVNARANEENHRLLNPVSEKSSNSEEYLSDSEDDFNIVLNDEDCKGFSVSTERIVNRDGFLEEYEDEDVCVKNGYSMDGLNSSGNGHGGERGNGVNDSYNSQYQHKLKQHGPLIQNSQINNSVGVASCSSKLVRGPREDDRYKHHEVSNTGQLTSIRPSTNFVSSHSGYGFSLPWHRTILDVNIDAFEEKRWRHPGVDISDFFNFGFDEGSWKQYCISLEQSRQQLYLHNRFHNYGFSPLTQACDIRAESGRAPEGIAQARSSSKFADIGEKRLGLPMGRAIQVEDGSGERQSKMDVTHARHPQIWDSDVVIQINVQDPGENFSGSSEEKFDHVDNVGLRPSTAGNLNVDDIRDVKDSDSSSADESLEDVRSSSMKGFPLPMSEPNKMNLAPDDPNKDHTVNAQTSEGIAEVTETMEKVEVENGKTICKPDQQLTEIEVSVGDRSHFSLTLSCSESESEASQDTVYNLPEASHRFLSRQSSGAKLLESDASDCKSPKSNVSIRKQDNRQNCFRHRSSIWEGRRHQNRRHHNVSQGRMHPDTSPMYRDNLSIDNCRQMERLRDFDYHNRHNFSCDQQTEFTGRYGGEKFAKVHTQDLHTKNPRLRYNQSFKNEVEPQQRRNWIEENFHERRIWFDDRDGLSNEWDSGERALSPRSMGSLTYGKSRKLFSNYNNLKKNNIQWRRKRDRTESGRQTNDDFLLDHQNEDYVMLHKYGRSVLLNSQRESFKEKYEKHVPSVGREAYLRERRDIYGYSPPLNLENPWCTEIEDEHWDLDSHNLSCWPHKDSYAANNRRLREMSPRSDIYYSGLDERYGRHGQVLDSEKYRDSDFVENYNDYDNVEGDIVYIDDQAHRGWRKYSWKSRILHQVECESILRQHDNISYRSSGSYGSSSRHERFQSNYRSSNGCTATGDVQLEGHRHKMFKGETNASFLNSKRHMRCRGQHDRTAWRYSNPVDLICEEGKSSGRHPCAASSMANGKQELMDQKFVKEQKVSRDFSGTRTRRATQCSISKLDGGKDDDKPQNRFPVQARNEDIDIEEGQIVPEGLIAEERQEIKSVAFKQNMKKRIHNENVDTRNVVDMVYDEQRIQDTLVKMERRRQRFQDPVASKKETDSILKSLTDSIADTAGKTQERPARKRQWGGR